jgi:predicted  nucleic acid-binding Zn-ribbon protein
VLSLSFGIAPSDYNYSGHGTMIDDYTANVIIKELKTKQARLEKVRKTLLDTQRKLGFMEGREKQLSEVSDQLSKVRAKMEFLQKKLSARKDKIGTLSKEELQKQFEKELGKRAQLRVQMDQLNTELAFFRNKYKESSDDIAMLRNNLSNLQEELTDKNVRLSDTDRKLKNVSGELNKTKYELSRTSNNLKLTKSSLDSAKRKLLSTAGQLKSVESQYKTAKAQAKDSQMDLYYAKGRLSATEKELAETKSRLERAHRVKFTRELELAEANKKLANLKQVLRTAVVDLSKTKGELNVVRTEAKGTSGALAQVQNELEKVKGAANAAKAELKQTKVRLSDAESKLRSDALEKYSLAAIKVNFNISENRLLMDYHNKETFCLPQIFYKGKYYIIGDLKVITGMFREITGHSKVYRLQYAVESVKNGSKPRYLHGPLISLNSDNRVCMMEIPKMRKDALKIITFPALRKRGVQDLQLFKYRSFGKGNTSLNGRCSLSFGKGDQYLYIRNSTRRSDTQMNAEPGDFVISKQGDYVGVVVAVENFDMNRRQEAKCYVFPDNFKISDSVKISLAKAAGQKYYTSFAKAVENMVSTIKRLDRMQRKRELQ